MLEKIKHLLSQLPNLEEICRYIEKTQLYYIFMSSMSQRTHIQKKILSNSIFLALFFVFSLFVVVVFSYKNASRNSALEKITSINLIDNFHLENIDNNNKIKVLKFTEFKNNYPQPSALFDFFLQGLNIKNTDYSSNSQVLKSSSNFEKVILKVDFNKINISNVVQILHRIESESGNLYVSELDIQENEVEENILKASITLVYYQKES